MILEDREHDTPTDVAEQLLRSICDRSLTSSAVRLLLLLSHDLPNGDFQRVKLWPIARRMGMKPHTIGSGLRLLVRRGYLEEEIAPDRERRYRLVSS